MITYSIIQKSRIEGAHRIDAEYYQPEYLEHSKLLAKYSKVNSLVERILHPKEIKREYSSKGILFLLAQNIRQNFIDWTEQQRMSDLSINQIKQNLLKDGDVVVVRSGVNFGDTACFEEIQEKVFASADVLVIRPQNISGYYLATFLNTKYGRSLLKRLQYGTAQPHIAPPLIKELRVARFNDKFENDMIKLVQKSKKLSKQSDSLYSQAEDLLLNELELRDFKIEDDLTYTVNLSDIKSAHRADADYFQPKYKRVLSQIKTHDIHMLGDLVSMKKGVEPGSDAYQVEGKLFIRVSSITKHGIIDKDQKYLSNELYQTLRKSYEPKIGDILLTKDATPGIAYVLKEPIEGIIAGGISRLKLKEEIEAEYLALCINSVIGQMQIERDAGGSVIVHWKPEQIKNLQVPILPKATQQKIADLVRQSHEAQKKAKELLEQAKKEVEKLIEDKN